MLKETSELLKEYYGLDDETFELFIKYHLATCERQELIGASSHTIDILKK